MRSPTLALAAPAALLTAACAAPVAAPVADPTPLLERVEHDYAFNDDVRLHYVTLGEGPLVVMLHGFPDYWYTWREQMEALSADYQVAALDLRGYNLSDQPQGVARYAMPELIGDVAAVIEHLGQERAIVVGHDWGGMVAWNVAMHRPDVVERLIVCNLPHPRGMMRELSSNREQQENSQYARDFQKEGAHEYLTAEGLASWVEDPAARELYVAAFERSSFEGMLAYYKANYPQSSSPAEKSAAPASSAPAMPRVAASVLMIHGLDDPYLLAAGLNDTWEWIDGDLTIATVPGASHFVQQDASEFVTRTMQAWLAR
jgi:pimeloyl-ACP methyl ester carboxylesterase